MNLEMLSIQLVSSVNLIQIWLMQVPHGRSVFAWLLAISNQMTKLEHVVNALHELMEI
jgi:hypothetical protein